MQTPALPKNEAERLAALAELEILDTEAEACFDGLTQLASQVLGVPISLVSLVAEDRQWFKSRVGLDATETSRDISFCGHVVASGEALVVADARLDARFADNPLVVGEPKIRFYAGVPLTTEHGAVLGTLCAIDRETRELSPPHRHVLETLATQVAAQLELRRKARHLAEEKGRLRAVLAEKEALLQEVHHRVKNNLQVVASLLNLQARELGGGPAREVVDKLKHRVRAIALLHEGLYRTTEFASVELGPYLRRLAAELQRSGPSSAGRVRIQCAATNVRCDLETAVPLGLIVNELVSNALEQAFVGKEQGVIQIDVSEHDAALELRIDDDGVSRPANSVSTESGPLSLRLVATLAQQLRAELGVQSNGTGNSVRLSLPPN
jgi:two-component sensor histidine kinase